MSNKSYKREGEYSRTHHKIVLTEQSVIKKNIMIHQPKVKLQEKINNRERERENNHLFRERPELDKFIENKMRRRVVKIKDIVTPNYPSHVM